MPVKDEYAVTIGGIEYPFSYCGIVSFSESKHKNIHLEGAFISKINAMSAIKIKNIGVGKSILAGIGKFNVEVPRAYSFISKLESKQR